MRHYNRTSAPIRELSVSLVTTRLKLSRPRSIRAKIKTPMNALQMGPRLINTNALSHSLLPLLPRQSHLFLANSKLHQLQPPAYFHASLFPINHPSPHRYLVDGDWTPCEASVALYQAPPRISQTPFAQNSLYRASEPPLSLARHVTICVAIHFQGQRLSSSPCSKLV